ncbi:hypothetical protein NHX12_027018 [Muraenolepis orangiensis]|uniref:Uncharacterized protein n=1 Tax=Muraenolepis orangiensis TaxID=630683 RepID=A0A9Q0EI76_9TELE|nr:hypothetical protein NHX12_027018 [Muraenolepis orangiensis]
MDRFLVLKRPRVDAQSKPPESERDSAHNRPREAEAEGVTVTDQEDDQEKPWEDGDEEEGAEMPGPAAAPAAALNTHHESAAHKFAMETWIKKTLPAILATLRDIIGLSNLHRRTEARALSAIIDETFVVHLIIFEDVFRTTKFMSDQLQSATFDLEAADDLAQSVTIAISEKRTEDKWREIRNEAESLCVNAGIAPQTQRERRRAQTSRHLEGFVVEAPLERARLDTDDLRTHSFYPVIDRLLMEMKRRFSTETNEVLRGVSALSPKHT